MGSPAHRRAGGAGLARVTLWAAIAVLALGGVAFSGCDIGGGDDDEPVTTPATTEATGPTGATDKQDDGGSGGGTDETGSGTGGADQTPADTGPAVPESGGVGVDDYDPETDSPENDQPPPPGSPQEKFEQACDETPGLCD